MAENWKPNRGYLPEEAKGKRVRVKLRHGSEPRYEAGPGIPPGWDADKARWRFTDSPFDIMEYLVI